MCSDYMDTQQEMFQFVTVTLESPLYLLIQRHYTLVPLFFFFGSSCEEKWKRE